MPTIRSRKEWMVSHRTTLDLSLKRWQRSGVAVNDELPTSNHILFRVYLEISIVE